MYHFNGGLYCLGSLAAYFARIDAPGDILGSVLVRTKKECVPVKLVFVRNRNNRGEYIIILSTDCSLSDAEIIRRYGYRRSLDKLVSTIVDGLANGTVQMDEPTKEEILNWYVSQPNFIRLFCGKQLANAELLASAVHEMPKCQQLYNLGAVVSNYKLLHRKSLWEV